MMVLVVFGRRGGVERCNVRPPGRDQPSAGGSIPPGERNGEALGGADDHDERPGGQPRIGKPPLSTRSPDLPDLFIIVPLQGSRSRDDRGRQVQGHG